jgi:hypothetical protein
MPQIIVERIEGSLADRRSSYRIYIDGAHRGDLASKETGVYDVELGTRSVKIGIDSYCSPPIKVAVLGRTRLVCRPSIAHAFGMVSRVSPSSWITVQEEPDVAADTALPKAPTPMVQAA